MSEAWKVIGLGFAVWVFGPTALLVALIRWQEWRSARAAKAREDRAYAESWERQVVQARADFVGEDDFDAWELEVTHG